MHIFEKIAEEIPFPDCRSIVSEVKKRHRASTRGAWTADDTSWTLLRAGWESLWLGMAHGENLLDVKDVLVRANRIWSDGFPTISRSFTRGAISATWDSLEDFESAVTMQGLGYSGVLPCPDIDRFALDLENAQLYTELRARRRELRLLLSRWAYLSVLDDGGHDEVWRLRLRLYSRRYNNSVAEFLDQASELRAGRLEDIFADVVRLGEWNIEPSDFAIGFTAALDGLLLQLAIDPARAVTSTASFAEHQVKYLCDGLGNLDSDSKTASTIKVRKSIESPVGIEVDAADGLLPTEVRDREEARELARGKLVDQLDTLLYWQRDVAQSESPEYQRKLDGFETGPISIVNKSASERAGLVRN